MRNKYLKILLFSVSVVFYTAYAEACIVDANSEKNTGWCIAGVEGGTLCIKQQGGQTPCIGNIIEVEKL